MNNKYMISRDKIVLVLVLLFYLQVLTKLGNYIFPVKILELIINYGIVIYWAIQGLHHISWNGIQRYSLKYCAVLILVTIVSIFGTELMPLTLSTILRLYITVFVAYRIFLYYSEEEIIESCIITQIIVILIQGLFLTIFRSGGFWYYDGIIAFVGSFSHKNHISAEMAFMINITFISLLYYSKNNTLKKARNIFVILASFYFMINTDGMGGILTFILTFGLCFLYYSKINYPNVGLVGACGGIGIYFLSSYANKFPELQKFMTEKLGRDLTFTGRLDVWNSVLDYVSQKPLTGYGYASFWSMNTQISSKGSSHNGIFELLLQFGYPTTIILIILFVSLFCSIKKIVQNRSIKNIAFELVFLTFLMIYMISERSFQAFHYHTLFFILSCYRVACEKNDIDMNGA